MYALEQKYLALLNEAELRQLPNLDGIHLCFQVLSLATAIDRNCAALLAPYGLSEGRFILLFLLEAAGTGLAPNVLAERAGVTRATVTGLLDGLERENLIRRQDDPLDKRALLIQLTPKGKALSARLFREHGEWIAGLFADINAEEREVMTRLLDKVANQTSKAGNK